MLAATSDSLSVGDLRANFFAVACAGIALRAIVSLHSYSGSGTPPMYGDYEAQRHWQELTVNIPVIEWYKNSSNNNLQYWGLDYPPLTAYHSYFMGKLAYTLNSSYVVLKKSHGIETASHKTFMRLTVLAADIILFIPSAILFAVSVGKIFDHYQEYILPALVIILIYPGQILVDNGHFQYNNISLGLTTLAVVCICREWHFFSSLLFTLAINYKQMELYHSIPFFSYILGQCLRKKRFYSHLVLHAITVVMTSIILWFPWILTLNSFKEVAGRIFPLARGVYEDKVANFWCAVNIVIKLRHISNQQLAKICAFSTFLSVTPTATNLYQKATKWNFVYSLFNCALGFYLFSFQVHEKSILLVALPATALYYEHPFLITWFLQLTTCSMIPLFIKDDLLLPSIIMYIIFYLTCNLLGVFDSRKMCSLMYYLHILSNFIMWVVITCQLLAPTPVKLPYLFTFILLLFIFFHFVIFFVFFTMKQLRLLEK